ncbi:MAG TPA: hypothetical protein DCK76_08340 [Desulfotomaculum sp.]|nr:hypothetical protein [Desulfotomaculum sp.]HBY05203.1 hypothetical protein [Desulfotomaculum sp.]
MSIFKGKGTRFFLLVMFLLMFTVFFATKVSASSTNLTIKKLASDGTTIISEETTLNYHRLKDNLPVMGDGIKHYYHQGPVFIDDADEETEQMLRWNQEENKNVQEKDMGALMGTNLIDLCDLVGGMSPDDTIKIKASDGFNKTFAYKNVYEYSDKEGPMVICWHKDGLYPDTGYTEGMRLVWFADASTNPWGINAFGNWDWHEAADPEYWYYFVSGNESYPTTTGLSVQEVSELIIYSNENIPLAPEAAFSSDKTSGQAPLTVQFTDLSTNSPASYAWDLDGNGSTDSTEKNPSYEYSEAGSYTVTLTVVNAAGSDQEVKADYITVTAKPTGGGGGGGGGGSSSGNKTVPTAAFIAAPASGEAPLIVNFTDASKGTTPLTYAWDFDNDGTVDSNEQNPSHQYDTAGAYSVKLTVKNDAGSDDEVKESLIKVEPKKQTGFIESKQALNDISGHWAKGNIEKLAATGAVSGYPDKTFKPDATITRAEFVTILVKAFEFAPQAGKVFADTASHWAKNFIATAAALGIAGGYDDNNFGPDDLITREQMAVMIAKAKKLDLINGETAFADKDSISEWAEGAVFAAVTNKIMQGYPDNTFRPLGNATRAEAVTAIVKSK